MSWRPDTSSPIIGLLQAGQILEVTGVEGTDAWAQIGPGQYVAISNGGKRYLEEV